MGSRPRLLPHRPFPPYAYLPGRHPHPVRDPSGHSHGEEAPAAAEPPAAADVFRWGADLFNHGYYWEAHEAWEPLWRAADRSAPAGRFLKGLILLSASGVKIRQGKLPAAIRHARRAAALLRDVDQAHGQRFAAAVGMPLGELAARAEGEAMSATPAEERKSAWPEPVFGFILVPTTNARLEWALN